jgi:hypothetical protein
MSTEIFAFDAAHLLDGIAMRPAVSRSACHAVLLLLADKQSAASSRLA